jgi:hypothetical protein
MEKGKRFSSLYIERGSPTRDSERFRNRLSAYYWENLEKTHHNSIVSIIHTELGVDVPMHGAGYRSVTAFFKECKLRDLLDSITVIYQLLNDRHYGFNAV